MTKLTKSKPHPAHRPTDPETTEPPKDSAIQIQEAKNAIIAAVIARAKQDGSYQHAKWLFGFGGVVPVGHSSPKLEPSLLRLLLDQLQMPETPEEIAAEFSANDHAVE